MPYGPIKAVWSSDATTFMFGQTTEVSTTPVCQGLRGDSTIIGRLQVSRAIDGDWAAGPIRQIW